MRLGQLKAIIDAMIAGESLWADAAIEIKVVVGAPGSDRNYAVHVAAAEPDLEYEESFTGERKLRLIGRSA